jgi:hypothetical protein
MNVKLLQQIMHLNIQLFLYILALKYILPHKIETEGKLLVTSSKVKGIKYISLLAPLCCHSSYLVKVPPNLWLWTIFTRCCYQQAYHDVNYCDQMVVTINLS